MLDFAGDQQNLPDRGGAVSPGPSQLSLVKTTSHGSLIRAYSGESSELLKSP